MLNKKIKRDGKYFLMLQRALAGQRKERKMPRGD